MSFDWQAFLDQRGIDYAERGPSTSRGNLYIHCPFCGEADQGRHMGVSTEGKGWGCWRNQAHRGKNPQRLIQALLGCSWAEAGRLAGKRLGGALWGADDAMGQMLAGFDKIIEPRRKLILPSDFKPLSLAGPALFLDYLYDRGYSTQAIDLMIDQFDLHWAMTGPFAYRIIFPIRDDQGSLVTWTGRAIGDAAVRYKTLTVTPDPRFPKEPVAHGPITDYLLNLGDLVMGGRFLVIGEGPFDAANLFVGAKVWESLPRAIPVPAFPRNITTTCLFGKAVSDMQLDRLSALREQYMAMFLVLDPEASLDVLQLADTMRTAGVHTRYLEGAKDPGEMGQAEMTRLFDGLAAQTVSFAKGRAKA